MKRINANSRYDIAQMAMLYPVPGARAARLKRLGILGPISGHRLITVLRQIIREERAAPIPNRVREHSAFAAWIGELKLMRDIHFAPPPRSAVVVELRPSAGRANPVMEFAMGPFRP